MSQTLTAVSAALPLASGWSVHSLWMRRRIEAVRRDPLTGLWTRAPFGERARKLLAGGQQRAVYVMDLNWFKEINDRFGHAAGDAVIRATGERLARWAADHKGVAGRLGGDEFAAVTDVCGEAATVKGNLSAKALDLVHRLEQPVVFDGLPIDVHVSVGVAQYWRGTADLSALLRLADESMYLAKREGGGISITPRLQTKPQMRTVNGRRDGRRGTSGEAA